MTKDEREELRRGFRPRKVQVFFIGESPPKSGEFFYSADSNLYTHTKEAFEKAYNKLWAKSTDFFDFFRSSGCYLDDLCLEPVNHLRKTREERAERRAIRRRAALSLSERIGYARPKGIIVTPLLIRGTVGRAIRNAKIAEARMWYLPFPVRGYQRRYVNELCCALKELRDLRVLPEDP